jgi:hypothetical protein
MDVFLVLHGPFASGGDRYFWNSQAGPTTSGARWGVAYNTNNYVQQPSPVTSIQFNSLPIPNNLQFILNAQYNASGNTNTLEGNATVFGTATSSTTYRTDPYNVTLGARIGGAEGYNSFDISEIIHLPTYDATENVSLGANINSYYSFTNWTPQTGFLADYPDAAAAYSVRQLSNNAIKCMRVRRTVAPFDEQDIGFTAGGDLDEAAIVAFGGSDVLTVSAWYDQSGQSNHATQITPNSQPQIYDGAAVITDNGKPAVEFDGLTSYLINNDTISGVSDYTIYFVENRLNDIGYSLDSDTGRLVLGNNQGAFFNTNNWRGTGLTQGAQYLNGYYLLNAGAFIAENGTVTQTGLTYFPSAISVQTTIYVNSQNLSSRFATGKVQEILIWNNDQSSNRTAIETDINDYFSIYP